MLMIIFRMNPEINWKITAVETYELIRSQRREGTVTKTNTGVLGMKTQLGSRLTGGGERETTSGSAAWVSGE